MATLTTEHRYNRPLSLRFTATASTLVTLWRFPSASSVRYVHAAASFSVSRASFWSEVDHVTRTGGLLGEAWQVMLMASPATAVIAGASLIDTRSAPTVINTRHQHYQAASHACCE